MISLFADPINSLGGTFDERHNNEDTNRTADNVISTTNKSMSGLETFGDLGLCDWVKSSCSQMGFRMPFPIQSVCIPSILQGKDVMGCAETGSGKTAAFALPILQKLSEDPFGIFALVLTPTRELAIQIKEQFDALGSPLGVRTALVIGGQNIIAQGVELSKRPHVVVATPGRLRHHLESADPPYIRRTKFLVLDEADRLLSTGFETELRVILSQLPAHRQTLLFSATLNSTLVQLETMAMKSALRFDLTTEQKIPATLRQEYLFMPAQVKLCYLVAVLRNLMTVASEVDREEADDDIMAMAKTSKGKKGSKKRKLSVASTGLTLPISVIIFAGTCKRCQETAEILNQMKIDCVALHSLLTQNRRSASLGKFKSQVCRVLVATDLAGRGLDIPAVDLVVNFDLPKVSSDYIHRVGRTARAGRLGRSLSLVTQYDVDLVHSIEAFTGTTWTVSKEVSDRDVAALLNPVAKAMHSAQLRMMELGLDEKTEMFTKRRKKQNRKILRKLRKKKSEDGPFADAL